MLDGDFAVFSVPVFIFVSLKRVYKLCHNVVYVYQRHHMTSVVYRYRQIVRYVVAERCNGAVVIRPAPFSEYVREAVNKCFYAVLPAVFKHQLLAGLFRFPVGIIESRLDRRCYEYRRFTFVFFQRIEQLRREAEIALHKFLFVFGTVYARKVVYKIGVFAVRVKLRFGRIHIVFIYVFYFQAPRSVLAVPNIF